MAELIGSLIIGLIAGLIASAIMPGGAKGCLWNTLLGLVGSAVGGWAFGLIGLESNGGVWGRLTVATVGAVILIAIYNALSGKKH